LGPTSILALLLGALGPVQAGGPVFVRTDGQPVRWDQSQPVRYVVDSGRLGKRSHDTAVAMVARAFQKWQTLPTARLEIEAAGELPADISGRNVLQFLDELAPGDPSPILFDSDGTILDRLIGRGASGVLVGFGLPVVDAQSGQIDQGVMVLCDRAVETFGFGAGFFEWACTHELGHFLGLAHSQLNGEQMFDGDATNDDLSPAMYYPGPNTRGGLHRDDVAWFSWLYPSGEHAAGTGTIRGRVLLPDRSTGLQGVQVFARRVGDPQVTAVSAVSGFRFRGVFGGIDDFARVGDPRYRGLPGGEGEPELMGEFLLPGLLPGSYTLQLQSLDTLPGAPVPAGYLVGGTKYWRAGSTAQDPNTEATPILVNAGQEVSGIDIIVSGEDLGQPQPVAEQEPNGLLQAQRITLPAVITGEVSDSEDDGAGAPVDSDPELQDVYQVALRESTVITALLSTQEAAADLDLYLMREGQRSVIALSNERAGRLDSLQLHLPPGIYYLGVHRSGRTSSRYTLRLLATPAPAPSKEPEVAWISYVLLGDVTPTSAVLRWQTTLEAPSVVYYNRPLREIGSTRRERNHELVLPELSPSTQSLIQIKEQVDFLARSLGLSGILGQSIVPVTTAVLPTANGVPHIVVRGSVALLDGRDVAEVVLQLLNAGNGDAVSVHLNEVALPEGWALLSDTREETKLPDRLELGRIGAGGAGVFILRMTRTGGSADPRVTVRGRYTDATGREMTF
jgi:hypothetical protein